MCYHITEQQTVVGDEGSRIEEMIVDSGSEVLGERYIIVMLYIEMIE